MCGGGPFRDRGPSDGIVPTPYENPVCATVGDGRCPPRSPSPRDTPRGAGNLNIGHMLHLCRAPLKRHAFSVTKKNTLFGKKVSRFSSKIFLVN